MIGGRGIFRAAGWATLGLVAGYLLMQFTSVDERIQAWTARQAMVLFGDFSSEELAAMEKYGRRSEGLLAEGDPAPDLALWALDGGRSQISDFYQDKPLVLVFGSYT